MTLAFSTDFLLVCLGLFLAGSTKMFLSSAEISLSLMSWFSVFDLQETHTPSVHSASGTATDIDFLLVLVTELGDEPL